MLTAGDHAPWFSLLEATGKRFNLRDNVGFPQLVVFHGSMDNANTVACLTELQKAVPEFEQIGLKVVSISPNSMEKRKEFAERCGITYSLLGDEDYQTTADFYHLCQKPAPKQKKVDYPITIFIFDNNLMIIGILSPFTPDQIPLVIDTVKQCCPKREPVIVTDVYAPPVLLIPDVLDAKTCQELMDIWEVRGNQISHIMRADGDKTYGVVDNKMKIRRDHFIRDEKLKEHINGFFQRRVYPEIEKCFNFSVYEYEHFKIACYDAAEGGYFRQHRDNTSGGTAHRKWAMTLNLNAEDYEGGYLRFPEYGPQLYKPATGSAVIFSCSLMHEATDVTAGKRFTLLSFFYGEKESRDRESYLKVHGNENYIPKEVIPHS